MYIPNELINVIMSYIGKGASEYPISTTNLCYLKYMKYTDNHIVFFDYYFRSYRPYVYDILCKMNKEGGSGNLVP